MEMEIVQVTQEGHPDFDTWLDLASKLWPGTPIAKLRTDLAGFLQSSQEVGFLIKDAHGTPLGFINLSLRHEYVPGAIRSPVAYVEGIYVQAAHRHQGVGSRLMTHAEHWARSQGCTQLASDAYLDNTTSHAFHLKSGFQEVERVVAFIKSV